MNRIHPLYIGITLLTILLLVFFKLSSLRNELKELKISYKETLHISQELSELKKIYAHNTKTRSSLSRILAQHSLKSAHITIQENKNTLMIYSKKMEAIALNSLMSKILNGTYQISQLSIQKIDKTHVSLTMEIKW